MTTSTNKLIHIPTELNAFTYLKHKTIQQNKIINNICKWIVILLIWNVLITGFLIISNIEIEPVPLDKIPVEYLEID